ncbi:MAG: hypothetical protein ACREJO_03980 [Phycisphaerales bacterium]
MKFPRLAMALLALLGLSFAGCTDLRAPGEPTVTIDLQTLDRVPVFPLIVAEGDDTRISLKHSATGTLRSDGTVVTCSHFIPRNHAHDMVSITGPWIDYQVLESGDGLGISWSTWSEEAPPLVSQDWAILQPNPSVVVATYFPDTLFAPTSARPPRVGETLYLVGYTVDPKSPEGRPRFARFWVPLLVVPTPESLGKFGDAVAWVQTASQPYAESPSPRATGGGSPSTVLRPGFSGSPVLRSLAGGHLEQCAIYHGSVQGRDDIGIVVATPDCNLPQQRRSSAPTPAATHN